ncbi:MAG: biotin--[acetyl-CoA-carboxylase] ligase [Thermoplasmata archaeon]|nr:biotin--[acetyl-CoA-carboxylase] ligase [Thermoplasmata archaeon]
MVGSTQTEAVALARRGFASGTVVVARAQSQGRGRLERSWDSPDGGLYLSVLVDLPTSTPELLPLAVVAELRAAFDPEGASGLSVKWPNDLVADRGEPTLRKLSGILVDRIARPGHPDIAVVGVGVNVDRGTASLAADVESRALFLEDLPPPVLPMGEVEKVVLRSIHSAVQRLNLPEGARHVVAECRRHLCGVGHPVRVDGHDVGVLRSLGDDGSITVDHQGTLSSFHAGDLSVGAKA